MVREVTHTEQHTQRVKNLVHGCTEFEINKEGVSAYQFQSEAKSGAIKVKIKDILVEKRTKLKNIMYVKV